MRKHSLILFVYMYMFMVAIGNVVNVRGVLQISVDVDGMSDLLSHTNY